MSGGMRPHTCFSASLRYMKMHCEIVKKDENENKYQ